MSDRNRLKEILATMNVPSARAELRDEADIHWLGRNLAIQNSAHPQIEEARELLEAAGARMVL